MACVDEYNIVSGKLQYANILDVSFFSVYENNNQLYKGKLNSRPGLPKVLYIIINIFIIIQLIGPSLYPDSTILWDRNSALTTMIRSIGCIWQLWSGTSRIFAGLVFSIIILIYECATIFFVQRFAKIQVMPKREGQIFLFLGKYVRPIFFVLAASGLPESIYQISEETALSIVYLIFFIIILILTPVDMYILCHRVLMENNPNHEWSPIYPMVLFGKNVISVLLSSSVGFVGKVPQAILMIISAIFYVLFSLYIYFFSPTVKHGFSLLLASFSFAGCLTSILAVVFLFVDGVSPIILVVLYIIFFVVGYFLFTFLYRKKVTDYLLIFARCEGTPESATEILLDAFKSPLQFQIAVQTVFDSWPPFLLTMQPFNVFTEKYPDNTSILLLWSRISALFPQNAELFRFILSQYANISTKTITRTVYLSELLAIHSFRFSESTPTITKRLNSITRRIEHVESLQRTFWERILQKSVEVFWSDVKSITTMLDKINNDILQLIDSYPNFVDIIDFYCAFLHNVKKDFIGYQEWSLKSAQLKDGSQLQADLAYQASHDLLPEVQQFCVETQLKQSEELSNTGSTVNNLNEDQQLQRVRLALQSLINKSKLGGIAFGFVVLTIGTIAAIASFIWLELKFKSRYVDDSVEKGNYITGLNIGLLNFQFLANYVAMFPLLMNGKIILCGDESTNPMLGPLCVKLMNTIAPNLYANKKVGNWTFDPAMVGSTIASLRQRLLDIQISLSSLDDEGYHELYQDLFVIPSYNGLSPIQAILKIGIDASNIMKISNVDELNTKGMAYLDEFDKESNDILNLLLPYAVKITLINAAESDSVVQDIRLNFILTMLITLMLIALPFNITYYLLSSEMTLVTGAFASLPNTSIREILQHMTTTKMSKGGSAAQSSGLSKVTSNIKENIQLFIIFLMAIGVITGCSVYLFYDSDSFATEVQRNLEQIATVHIPAVLLLANLYRDVRAYSKLFLSDKDTVGYSLEEQINLADSLTIRVQNSSVSGIWGTQGTADSYYKCDIEVDYFNDVTPFLTDQKISKPMSLFEEIAACDILEEFEIAATNFHFLQLTYKAALINNSLKENVHYMKNDYFIYLLYFFLEFAPIHRLPQFFIPIVDEIDSIFISRKTTVVGMIVAVIIVQIAALFLMFLYLYYFSRTIKRSLHLLLFFNPKSILQNRNLMLLLTKRDMKSFEDKQSFIDAQKIVENTEEAIVLIDKKLIINDVNKSFVHCVETPQEDLIGKPITDILQTTEQFKAIQQVLKLNDAFKGTSNTTYSEQLTIRIPSGQEKSIKLSVICMTPNGPATESNSNDINSIIFIIDDETEQKKVEKKIYEEKEKITDMLNKVLPINVIDELQKGSESVSFTVQSATIGCITIKSPILTNSNDLNAPYKLLSGVFDIFDEMLKDFPQLTKVRTYAYTYEYAGGVFGSVNKPDKHAEEATRFALKVMSSKSQIESVVGHDISFVIGLNTGGPLVAGVISIGKPSFHLIGPAVTYAKKMEDTAEDMQVQITRSVYELIYAYNFHVTDRGEINIGGGKTMHTYYVSS